MYIDLFQIFSIKKNNKNKELAMHARFFLTLAAILLSFGSGSAIAQASQPSIDRKSANPTSLSPTQLAQQEPLSQNRPNRRRGRGLSEALNLSSEQKQQVQSIQQKYRSQVQSLQQELRQRRQNLIEMIGGEASESEIRNAHQQVMNKRQELGNLRFDSLLEIRSILTPEQRSQWADFMRGGPRRGAGSPR
jgi:Spy/CpxP family protein refolding chaperone